VAAGLCGGRGRGPRHLSRSCQASLPDGAGDSGRAAAATGGCAGLFMSTLGCPLVSLAVAIFALMRGCCCAATSALPLLQVLSEGDIPQAPPVPSFGEAEVRQGEVREQAPIGLACSQSLRCTVCFSRGQEQEAVFAVEGLPAHVKAGASPGAWACLPAHLPACWLCTNWLAVWLPAYAQRAEQSR
jgi:hypothetical protein